ncbi:MAG: hypothetical protein ABEJ87_02710, partial [Candidatus Nanohalobium sp.]
VNYPLPSLSYASRWKGLPVSMTQLADTSQNDSEFFVSVEVAVSAGVDSASPLPKIFCAAL